MSLLYQVVTIDMLSLRARNLGTAHIKLLLPYLPQFVALTCIDLSDNRLTADGVQALVDSLLQPSSPLRDLRLANNWFGPKGVQVLARALEADVGLRRLDVSNTDARPQKASYLLDNGLDSDQYALKALADAIRVYHFVFVVVDY